MIEEENMYKESWICDSCGNLENIYPEINIYRTPAKSLPPGWQIATYDPELEIETPGGETKKIPHSIFCENCKDKLLKYVIHVSEEDIPF